MPRGRRESERAREKEIAILAQGAYIDYAVYDVFNNSRGRCGGKARTVPTGPDPPPLREVNLVSGGGALSHREPTVKSVTLLPRQRGGECKV